MIKEAKKETIDSIQQGWEQQQKILFLRDGVVPRTGKIGQDLKNNPELQNTISDIVESYIPLCARKVELRERQLEIENDKTLDRKSMLIKQRKEVGQEIKAIDTELVYLNRLNIMKLMKEKSGAQRECERHGTNLKNTANKAFGTAIRGLVDSINSKAVTPVDGLVPVTFTR